jgi:N-acetylglucosaminyl-diphospho-decaprenol L-rhamnosyltransferase
MKNYNKLTILLIAYKSEKKIYKFVKHIPKNIKIVIIENSKNILFKRKIEKLYKNIKVYIKTNEGVGASINYGAKKIQTKYFLQISPDIIFNYKDLDIFLDIAKELNDKFAGIGPRFLKVKKKSHKQIKKNLEIGLIESIHGSCMFINKKRFNEIGGFDKKIFLYFEETEYCKRALSKGLKSYQTNKIKVKRHGRSVLVKNKTEKNRLDNICIWHFIWSKYYYTKKHYGIIISLIIFFPILIRILFKIIYHSVIQNKSIKEKYQYRLSGLITAIRGKKSSLRF